MKYAINDCDIKIKLFFLACNYSNIILYCNIYHDEEIKKFVIDCRTLNVVAVILVTDDYDEFLGT